MGIYLDHAATTPLSAPVKQYLISILDLWGNPSSLHSVGEPAKQILSEARHSVAKFIHADPTDIYFTGGGAAGNTLGMHGYASKHDCTILYSPIAHKSVLKCAESHKKSHPLKVDRNGFLDFDDLKEQLDTYQNPFVVVDHANSEIGTIQDVEKLIDLVHLYQGTVYLDCTGSIPAIPIDVKKLNIDMLGFSAHKLGGLKGCGVFYKKKGIELEPLVYGTQEQGLIGGTENVLGIASLGKAVESHDYSSVSSANRDYVYNFINNHISDSYLIGASVAFGNRLPHNLYMCFRGVEGESLMILLDLNGIQVSTGSACNSGNRSTSATLSAIGMDENDITSSIRMTFSGTETKKELDHVCKQLKYSVDYLRSLNTNDLEMINK